jgi:hypothetical protein
MVVPWKFSTACSSFRFSVVHPGRRGGVTFLAVVERESNQVDLGGRDIGQEQNYTGQHEPEKSVLKTGASRSRLFLLLLFFIEHIGINAPAHAQSYQVHLFSRFVELFNLRP